MLNWKKTKIIPILVLTLSCLLIQNSQEESDKTNHNKENERLLKKAIEMHKLFEKLKKERKPDKEKYKELQKKMIRKLQRCFTPITHKQNQNNTTSLSLLEGDKKRIKKLNIQETKNIQTRTKSGVSQLKTIPFSQLKPIPSLISLKSRTSNFTLKLPKISETKSSLEYKKLVIKKEDLLYKLTNLQRKIEGAIKMVEECGYITNYITYSCENFDHELNSMVKSLKYFNKKIGALISEITGTEYSELSYEKMKEFRQQAWDLESYYYTNINELINKIPDKVKKVNNLPFKLESLRKLIISVAKGEEPYSDLSLEERKRLYQNLRSEYEEIVNNELRVDKSDRSVAFYSLSSKTFPDFVFKETRTKSTYTQQNKPTTQEEEQYALLRKLTLLVVSAESINPLVTYSTNVKKFIESNLQTKQWDILFTLNEEKNCEDEKWKEKLKEFITFDNGKVTVKDDFIYLSNKDTLNRVIERTKNCSSETLLPEWIKKLFDGLKISKKINGKTESIPITTYGDMFNYISNSIGRLLRDTEEIKTNIYQGISYSISSEAKKTPSLSDAPDLLIMKVISSSNSLDDDKQVNCIAKIVVKDVAEKLKEQGISPKAIIGFITGEIIKQAFRKCNVTEAQEKRIIEFMIKSKIDEIGFKTLLSIAENSERIIKSSLRLFNPCQQVSEDITKLISFKPKYDAFVKTFNLFWDEFLFTQAFKDTFLSGKNSGDWYLDHYKYNKEAQQVRADYICIVRLHQYASSVLTDLYENFTLNRNLLDRLCLDEIRTVKSGKERRFLQTKFESLLESEKSLSKACRIIKIYQKKEIKLDKIEDINNRIEYIF